ncbi:sulfite exporter TauE/SafE family protein [Candidatus Gottesmanbacteria bacterium]|nr:sulfite exporter TauE/SafE family protein [Candidatus Gottesmanbacteria bacterium]
MSLWAVFLTGLFTGGLTCLVVQGGLLATTIAQRESERLKGDVEKTGHALPIIFFLIAKLVAYTVLGFALGWVGSLFTFSLQSQIILQTGVAIFMIGTAMALLNVHPIFRYFIIAPPKFLFRLVRQESKSKSFFAPAVLGAFTVFVPCGTTQAMIALAIASGSPFLGATILAVFVLGTSPLFFILGYFASRLGGFFQAKFTKVAAFAVILIAAFNLNNAIALTGSPFTIESILGKVQCAISFCGVVAGAADTTLPLDSPTITIGPRGYSPQMVTLRAGSRVKLTLNNVGGGGCTQAFTIPALGLQRIVPLGSTDTIEFDVPNEKGTLAFMCSMGMFRGEFEII